MFFQRSQIMRIVSFSPIVEGLARNAEISAGFGDIMAFMVIIHPLQLFLGFRGQIRKPA